MTSNKKTARRLLFRSRFLITRLRSKGVRYWATSLLVIVLTLVAAPHVYDYLHLSELRARFFQQLLDWGPRPPEPNFTRIVLVKNDEYWGSVLAGRRPIKRDYLARLIDKLTSLRAHVIAVDFDLRTSDPTSFEINEDYKKETDVLTQSIIRAAESGTKIVLAAPISYDQNGEYQRDADPYQAHGLCRTNGQTTSLPENVTKNVACGYISLPYDPLAIPGPLRMSDGTQLDSFSLAIARMERPELVKRLLERLGTDAGVRYSNFISDDKFQDANAIFSARSVLQGGIDIDAFTARAVLIGANWSQFSSGRGPNIDQHWTPVGLVVGATLHANFAEAFLDSRIFRATPDWILHAAEITFSVLAALVFALAITLRGKLFAVLVFLAIMLVVQWAMLHGFGVFFDVLVPLLGLALHSLYEGLLGSSEPAK